MIVELEAKRNERLEAHQQFIDSQTNCAQKETAHKIRKDQLKEDAEQFQTASKTYNERLEKLGFESPEDHNTAFRDAEQMQEFQEKIDTYEEEIQNLNDTMTELTKEFEDSPYEPDKLGQIIEKEEETEEKIEEIQKTIGAKQQIIKDLKDNLEKTERT